MSYRIEFQEEMAQLHQEIMRMGAKAEEAIQKAIKALQTGDLELARDVIRGDDTIDEFEREINQACIRTIARQKPVAGDLRDVTANIKLVTDLERIADHAEDIAQHVIRLYEKVEGPGLVIPEDVWRMSEAVKTMLHGALDAYVGRDSKLAWEVIRLDDTPDELCESLGERLEQRMKDEGISHLGALLELLLIVYNLERAADHAQNIAEWVVYYIDGEYVYE